LVHKLVHSTQYNYIIKHFGPQITSNKFMKLVRVSIATFSESNYEPDDGESLMMSITKIICNFLQVLGVMNMDCPVCRCSVWRKFFHPSPMKDMQSSTSVLYSTMVTPPHVPTRSPTKPFVESKCIKAK
jgi:hypothetical protein